MSASLLSPPSPLTAMVNAHFLLGGVFFGLLGALLLRVSVGIRGKRWVGLVGAKYLSTFLVLFPLSVGTVKLLPSWLGSDSLGRLPWVFLVLGLVVWLLSALLEWPFFQWAQAGRGASHSLALSLRANAIALVLLIAYYLPVCELGLLKHSVPTSQATSPLQILYLRDGNVFRRQGGGTEECLVSGLNFSPEARLFARRGEGGWELWLQDLEPTPRRILENIAPSSARIPQQPALHMQIKKAVLTGEATISHTWGKPAEAIPEMDCAWSLRLGRWPWEGLEVSSREAKEAYRVALDTPLVSWNARCATRVTEERVVFQMGPFLWVLALDTRQAQILARGQGALVVL